MLSIDDLLIDGGMAVRVFWSVLFALVVFSGLCWCAYALVVAVERQELVRAQETLQRQVVADVQHAWSQPQYQPATVRRWLFRA